VKEIFPEKPISAITKIIISSVDKNTVPDEIPVFLCNYKDVYYNSIITKNMQFMEATAKKSEIDRFSLYPNDVVITKDSESADDIGIPTYIQSIRKNLLCGYHLAILRPKKNVDGKFLSFALMHPRISYDFSRYANGITRFGLTSEVYSKVKIPLPPLPEQKAIADLLSTWDEAIEKTERLIQAKEMRFKWLLQELISKPQKNKKWKMVKLGSFLTESRIPDLENNPKKRLSVRLHLKGVEIREYRGTESDGATAYFIRKAGQFIYGKQNIFRGSIGIVPPDLDGYSSTQDIPAFDISDSVCKNWLLFLFSYPNFYKKLELYASGSGSKRLHPIELFKIKIGLPSIEEQKQIAETLSTAQHEINLLKQLVEKYKIQKRGLMQKMLTGTWRIKPEIINQYKEE